LPPFPRHAEGGCSGSVAAARAGGEKVMAFSALSALKQKV